MSGSRVLLIAAVVGLLGGGSGCKWFDRAEADRHDRNAEKAAKDWNFGKMMDEGKKADKSDKAAKKDPLP